jgi:hypothetical protein
MRAFDADLVTYRMEEAGTTLLAIPPHYRWSTRPHTASAVLAAALEAYGWTEPPTRPAVPTQHYLDRMDEAFGWLDLIPTQNYLLRRVVGARSLVHPNTDRHLFSWRRLADALGSEHRAVQRWHTNGIGMIVAALNVTADQNAA